MPPRYNRVTQPLVRENGELRPASWDEALDRAAAGFRKAVDEGSPRVALHSNNIDSCNRT
jgi:predicted molibdopterin-dependent oxidoreductase YjgC